jgi:hypothetical protein
MSDVGHELTNLIESKYRGLGRLTAGMATDAILERFDVTPKPAISAKQLGRIVQQAELCCGPGTDAVSGERMLKALNAAGLKIVRVDE